MEVVHEEVIEDVESDVYPQVNTEDEQSVQHSDGECESDWILAVSQANHAVMLQYKGISANNLSFPI